MISINFDDYENAIIVVNNAITEVERATKKISSARNGLDLRVYLKVMSEFSLVLSKIKVVTSQLDKLNNNLVSDLAAFSTLDNNIDYKVFSVNGFTFYTDLNGNIVSGVDKDGKPISIFGDYNIATHQYGGNQNIFLTDERLDLLFSDEMLNIIKKYYPDVDVDSDYDTLLNIYHNKLGSAGCGYIAIANCILKAFEGKEKKFQETYGFPMYTVDVATQKISFNYEKLAVDYYFYTCRKSLNVDFNEIDNPLSLITGTTGYKSSTASYLTDYLSDYGISGNAQATNPFYFPSVDDYEKLKSEGSQIITLSYLWRVDTSSGASFPQGDFLIGNNLAVTSIGHAMYINDDGIMVSTWGGKARLSWSPIGKFGSEFIIVNIDAGGE